MKCMQKIVCFIILYNPHINAMETSPSGKQNAAESQSSNQRITLLDQDGHALEINKNIAFLFGTVKDVNSDTQHKDISLKRISGDVLKQLIEDIDSWVLDLYAGQNNTVATIATMPESDRIQHAKKALIALEAPDYSEKIMSDTMSYLQGAQYLNIPELRHLYAKTCALLLTSNRSFNSVHSTNARMKHPIMAAMPEAVASEINNYMPQKWIACMGDKDCIAPTGCVSKIKGIKVISPNRNLVAIAAYSSMYTNKYKEGVLSLAFSSDYSMIAVTLLDSIMLHDTQTGELLDKIEHCRYMKRDCWARDMAFSQDNSVLVNITLGCPYRIVAKRLTNTLNQAMLVRYLLWCQENEKKPGNTPELKEWMEKVVNTFPCKNGKTLDCIDESCDEDTTFIGRLHGIKLSSLPTCVIQ